MLRPSLIRQYSGHSRSFSGSLLKTGQSLVMGVSQVCCSQSGGGQEICSVKPENFMTFAGLSIPMFSTQSQIVHDIVVSTLTACVALGCLRFWDEIAKRDIFDQKLNRKFVHISIGLIFMLFWPLFSTGRQAPYLAALAPGVNILRMIGLGLGILKNEAMVKSMSRNGNARELLKGPLYYACTLTFITIQFWRTSPIGSVAIANLCAGDGFADIAGRRLGTTKLPYNRNKSFAGSFAMLVMGFTVSVGYLFYFASFGYYKVSLKMLFTALFVSTAATIKLNRKFVHISIGLIFMLFWPLFSTGPQAPYLAALAPGVNILRMIGLGLGILKNEAMVKSMSRNGNARELLKGPLYYACTLTFITILFWRTSPIGPVAVANLCAGDGFADIAGRRRGTTKLPYNRNKSFVGSFAMLVMGFTVSVGYLFYFASFGYYKVSLKMLLAALFVSTAATIVESLPISTELDDNLTVSLASAVVGSLVF